MFEANLRGRHTRAERVAEDSQVDVLEELKRVAL